MRRQEAGEERRTVTWVQRGVWGFRELRSDLVAWRRSRSRLYGEGGERKRNGQACSPNSLYNAERPVDSPAGFAQPAGRSVILVANLIFFLQSRCPALPWLGAHDLGKATWKLTSLKGNSRILDSPVLVAVPEEAASCSCSLDPRPNPLPS